MSHRIEPASKNALCDLVLLDSERHELLTAYEKQRERGPYPPLAVQIFAHNVRHNARVTVYVSQAAEVLSFAHTGQLAWLEQHIVAAYAARRKQMKAHFPQAPSES